jgi:hypothetical protein
VLVTARRRLRFVGIGLTGRYLVARPLVLVALGWRR